MVERIKTFISFFFGYKDINDHCALNWGAPENVSPLMYLGLPNLVEKSVERVLGAMLFWERRNHRSDHNLSEAHLVEFAKNIP